MLLKLRVIYCEIVFKVDDRINYRNVVIKLQKMISWVLVISKILIISFGQLC